VCCECTHREREVARLRRHRRRVRAGDISRFDDAAAAGEAGPYSSFAPDDSSEDDGPPRGLGRREKPRRRGRYRGDISRFDDASDEDPSDASVAEIKAEALGYQDVASGDEDERRRRSLEYRPPPPRGLARRPPPLRGLGPTDGYRPPPLRPVRPQSRRYVPETHGLGTGPGSGHVRDAAKAHFRYNQAVGRGETFGSDVARYVQYRHIDGDPVDRAFEAISRFSRRR
jgi:hypothetical protein